MISKPKTTTDLVRIAQESALYQDLVLQLKKDFEMSGLDFNFQLASDRVDLLTFLQTEISYLMTQNFDAYLQLLYRIDVSETYMQVDALQEANIVVQKAVFALLHKEWQKVYYRKLYSQ